METYFVIHNGDGDTTVEEFTKKALLKNIEEGYWGDVNIMPEIPDGDTNYWGGDIIIIKGEIITPEEKEVVTKYDIK